jgi:hypothetical protein
MNMVKNLRGGAYGWDPWGASFLFWYDLNFTIFKSLFINNFFENLAGTKILQHFKSDFDSKEICRKRLNLVLRSSHFKLLFSR